MRSFWISLGLLMMDLPAVQQVQTEKETLANKSEYEEQQEMSRESRRALEAEIACLQEQMCELGSVNLHNDFGPNLRTSRPRCGSGLYVTLEYLYWKTFQGGVEYAYKYTPDVQPQLGNAVGILNGDSKEVCFNFDSGIRPGVGYTLPYDGWDLHLFYTYFRNSEKEDVSTGELNALFPLLAYQALIQSTDVGRAKADALLRFQTLDLEFGRDTFLSRSLLLRSFFGPRFGWIDQELDVTYSDEMILPNANPYRVEIDNAFWGGGLRTGFDLSWLLGKGFFLMGDFAFSLLWGHLNVTQDHTAAGFKVLDQKYKLSCMIPNIDLQTGFGWEIWFNETRNHFALTFAYEMQYLWNVTQYARFVDNVTPNSLRVGNDIGLHGLTIKGRMDF